MNALLKQAALYARVSSQQQANSNTIASQVDALQARIKADGFRLEAEFRFVDEGHSGGTLFRPALERLRDQAAAGVIDRLYVHSPDRLARNYAHQFLLVEELRRGGVEVVFLNRAIGQSPEDDLLLQMQGMMAEYERAKILERSRRGKRHAAQAGSVNVLSGAPYGYVYIDRYAGGGQARYQIHEEHTAVVRQIFAWVGLERCSLGEVCRRLKSQAIPSPTGKSYWDRATIWGMLKNAAYKGEAQFGKTRVGPLRPRVRPQRDKPMQPRRAVATYDTEAAERVVIVVPALIDADLFAAVAEQLEENRRRRRESKRGARYLLQGLLVCGCCRYAYYGKPLSQAARKGKNRDCAYYRCIGTDAYRFGGQRVCSNGQCRTDVLDKAVWDDVCSLLADPERVRREYDQRRMGKRHKDDRSSEVVIKQIAKVRRGIARLIDAYEEGLLQKDEFEPRIQEARQRLKQLEQQAKKTAEHEAEEADVRVAMEGLELFAQQVGTGLREADWEARRSILRALIKQVEVGKDAMRIVYRVSPCPFERGPERANSQDCWRGDFALVGEHLPALVREVLLRPTRSGHLGSGDDGSLCR
jgi:site-specific DNA recombinase